MLALLSVYNKTGIVEFAAQLKELGWDLLSSGGTAKALQDAGIEVKDVAELVGGGAILGHKVVTLSRELHAGLLADKSEQSELDKLGIPRIDLVCVDMYPLVDEIEKADCTCESVRDKTDIGGPTMLRSAAKGRRIVVCDIVDRTKVINWLINDRPDEEEFITRLAAKAEFTVANYVMASAEYHGHGQFIGISGMRFAFCRYGENIWQAPAAIYSQFLDDPLALDKFKLVAGTSPSYNNWVDLDRMLQTITHIAAVFESYEKPVSCYGVAVKHGNACGASYGDNSVEVTRKIVMGDPRAIFGGLVMVNFSVNEEIAEDLLTYGMPEGKKRLLDGIVAPKFTEKAVEILKRKAGKCRLLANEALANMDTSTLDNEMRFRMVRGGLLLQPNYEYVLDMQDPELEFNGREITSGEDGDLRLAWAIGSTSNSNTVTLVKNSTLIGNGVGQQDRVGGCQLAVKRAKDAGHDPLGSVAYSDSFFPFDDGPYVLSQAGVKLVLASSGSVNDKEIVDRCSGWGMDIIHIPDGKARGFFGH